MSVILTCGELMAPALDLLKLADLSQNCAGSVNTVYLGQLQTIRSEANQFSSWRPWDERSVTERNRLKRGEQLKMQTLGYRPWETKLFTLFPFIQIIVTFFQESSFAREMRGVADGAKKLDALIVLSSLLSKKNWWEISIYKVCVNTNTVPEIVYSHTVKYVKISMWQ